MNAIIQKFFLLFATLFYFLFVSQAVQAEIIVAQDGSRDFVTIGEAIANAVDGDEIIVLQGNYHERDLNFNGKNLTLRSDMGPRFTIIDPQNIGRAFKFYQSGFGYESSVIDGFTIQNCSAGALGGAIEINNASPTIKNSIFRFNNNKYFPNTLYNGGAISITGGAPVIENCLFWRNESSQYGGAIDITGGATPTISNCTFGQNSTGTAGGALSHNTTVTVNNSIFWENSAPVGSQINNFGTLNLGYSVLQGGIAAISGNPVTDNGGNIDQDPLFHGYGNYHVRPGSPCIDGGTGDGAGYALDGPNGTRRMEDGNNDGSTLIDIGAYEYKGINIDVNNLEELLASPQVPDGLLPDGATLLIEPATYTPQSDFISIQDRSISLISTGGLDDPVIIDGQDKKRGLVIQGVSSESMVAIEGFSFIHCRVPTDYTIDPYGQGSGGGLYIEGAMASFRNCSFNNNHAKQGGALYFSDSTNHPRSSIAINSCQFSRNKSSETGGALAVNSPGKVDIQKSFFYENRALSGMGGAIYTTASGQEMAIIDTRFIGNRAALSGGALASEDVDLLWATNTVFQKNSSQQRGGALYFGGEETGQAIFTFTTFQGNTAAENGGALYSSSGWQMDIYNSIFWGNSAEGAGDQISSYAPQLQIFTSVLQGGVAQLDAGSGQTTAMGIIEDNPLFVYDDDLHLMPESPCIDQGMSVSPNMLPTDLENQSRVIDGNNDSVAAADMGAYEHPVLTDSSMGLSREFFTFRYNITRNVVPDVQYLSLKNNSGREVSWSFTSTPSWLSVSPDGSQEAHLLAPAAEETVTISCVPAEIYQMVHGTFFATLVLTDAVTGQELGSVQVELVVSRTITVPTDYPTIQQAVDTAVDGDEVIVESGTYTGLGNRNITFRGKSITVRSANGPESTIIDIEQIIESSGFIFNSGEDTSSVLEGFTITRATNSGVIISNGGAATILNCIFLTNGSTKNENSSGGAIYIEGDGSYIANCTFRYNEAGYGSGGNGGAIYIYGDNTIYNCLFFLNGQSSVLDGGAIYIAWGSNIIRSSRFEYNSAANFGGAIRSLSGENYVQNCTFNNNSAFQGGALHVAKAIISNSLFYTNQAGRGSAIELNGGSIFNCSFVENSGGASVIQVWSTTVPVINTLFYKNTTSQINFSYSTGSASVSYCAIPVGEQSYYENSTQITLGAGMQWLADTAQPLVDYIHQDFRLNPEELSCIDQGTDIPDIYSDIRGSLRPIDGGGGTGGDPDGRAKFDIGAYEYSHYYGGAEKDSIASPFINLHIASSVIIVGHEYEIEWKDEDPFPNADDRVQQAGEYNIMLSLVDDSGRRINLLNQPGTVRISPLGYSIPVSFTADHLGTWRIRLEIANDPNQFIESQPVTIEYKDVISKTMGERIFAPAGALADQKPEVDIEGALYWSADTNRLWAVKPTTAVITWYANKELTEEISTVIHINKPAEPQIHIAETQPVALLPQGTPYDMVSLLYTGSGAALNANTFSAENEGYAVLFFRDEQAVDVENKEIFQVVRTVAWNHTPVDQNDTITYPYLQSGYLGSELTDNDHNSSCGSGYVFFEQSWYDGYGENRAYDRAGRTGPIFPVNALDADSNDTRDDILVVWYAQESTKKTGVCWPYKPVNYEIELPVNPEVIVISSGLGSGELQPIDFGSQEDMLIYNQPDRNLVGYNPNEEHAAFFTGQASEYPAVFALRNDLNRMQQVEDNNASGGNNDGVCDAGETCIFNEKYSSPPYVLLKYHDPKNNNAWNFKAYKVVPYSSRFVFNGTVQEDTTGNSRYYIDTAGNLQTWVEPLPAAGYYIDAGGQLKNPADTSTQCYNFSTDSISPVDCIPGEGVKTHYIDIDGALQVLSDPQPELRANGLLDPGILPEKSYFIDSYGVLVESARYYRFYYPKVAGAEINPFYPLNQLTFGPCAESFTTTPNWVLEDKDHKFFAKNGGIDGGIEDVGIKYFYRLQTGFFYDRDNNGFQDSEIPIGTCIPLLDHGTGDPQLISFGVEWPTPVPTLYVGETLMAAKMQKGESVGLPNIKDQCTVNVLFDQPVEQHDNTDFHSVNLIDPLKEYASEVLDPAPGNPEMELPQTLKPEYNLSTDRWEFAALPQHLRLRLTYDAVDEKLKLKGHYAVDSGEPTVLLNVLTSRDMDIMQGLLDAETANLSIKAAFQTALATVVGQGQDGLVYPSRGVYPVLGFNAESKALTAGDARGIGYVTLAFNNHENCAAPTSLSVIRVGGPLYRGEIKVIESENPFEEKLTLRHNGDFGGKSDGRWFQWKYVPADFSGIPCPPGETPETYGQNCEEKDWQDYFAVDAVNLSGSDVQPDDKNPDDANPGNDDENFYKGAIDVTVQGTGQQLLGDKWFSVRYFDDQKLLAPNYPVDYWKTVSGWTNPQLYEGWIKRVMKKINLFDQKARDFHAGDVNTIASMIALAGAEYEGDVALSDEPEYLQSLGMIDVYETLLSRGVSLAEGVDSADINKALLFAANRLADLYMLLGNEAYGDAEDPTIGFSTADGQVGSEAASIFCFENQVATLLDEELSLLRGREEPGIRPYYNRLVWNFTLGDGEVAYRENYNITDQPTLDTDGDTFADTPDGEINEMDAKLLFPMGHGDAWGHYLSAIKKYYSLFKRDNFTWIPQSEAILVAGNPVQVDYRDERKFAVSAAARARTGAEIVNLTYRKFYTEDPKGQWQGYKDTDIDRRWGLDGWSKRAGQGAFFDWVAGNAMLPDKPGILEGQYSVAGQTVFTLEKITYTPGLDSTLTVFRNGSLLIRGDDYTETANNEVTLTTPSADGDELVFEAKMEDSSFAIRDIQKIDRTTVLELGDIASRFNEIQAKIDEADAQLNPVGLAKGAVPFDIDPARVANGETHFEQIYNRAVDAMNNAIAVFNHAGQSTNLLRKQQDSLADFKRNVENTEADYTNRLIEIYGYPYTDDCGPGKLYPTSYCSSGPDLYHYMYSDASKLMGIISPEVYEYQVTLKDFAVNGDGALEEVLLENVPFHVSVDSRFGIIRPDSWTGNRKAPGEIQLTHSDLLQTRGRFDKALEEYGNLLNNIELQADLIQRQLGVNRDEIFILNQAKGQQISLNNDIMTSRDTVLTMKTAAQLATIVANAAAESLPTVAGVIAGMSNGAIIDVTSSARSAAMLVGTALNELSTLVADSAVLAELANQQAKEEVSLQSNIDLTALKNDFAVRQQLLQLENLIRNESILRLELFNLMEGLRQSAARYLSVMAKGQRLIADRLRIRRQTAAQIQDYRYTDMTFRIFRNDALQKYRAQFDMAARYVYLAAKAYDYETTLLDSDTRAGEGFLTSIVKQRTIGLIENGLPLTGSGLADPMKRMYQNFQVLKSQLGFNNPQIETNRFSLRQELMRIKMDSGSNITWRNALKNYWVDDLWHVPEFRRYCRPFTAEGIPQAGLVIPFTTTVTPGLNFFGWPLGGGDSYYSSTNFATKIRSVGVWFSNYNTVGLAQTPRIYLIPVGEDVLRTPSSSFNDIRTWQVIDQKLPQPFPINSTEFENNPDWIPAVDTIFDEMFEIRKHSDFRAYHDSGYLNQSELQYDSRLIGRSVWNSRWLLIIPGQSLLYDPVEGLETFIEGPTIPGSDERTGNGILDIKLFFETYGYSGN